MYIALNSNFIRTYIDDTVSNDDYFCPYCKAPLEVRKGDIRQHHFAHAKRHRCTDTWSVDRTKNDSTWHKQWQERFPIDNQEISLCLGQIRHRADVMVDRTVLEFQHSPLSSEKFSDRNAFYAGLGHKVIWIFDYIDEDFTVEGDSYQWKKPKKTFRNYNDIARANQTELYFQIDENTLIHVTYVLQEGFECFKGYKVTVDDFILALKLQDNSFPIPKPEDICGDPEYIAFKHKYGIELNKQQERAAQSISGANLLLAVPGSGKTTVLITRIGYMVHCKHVVPDSILALTYTTKATKEMDNRYKEKFGDDGITFKTINAIAENIIRFYCKKEGRERFTLLSESEIKKYMQRAYTNVTGEYPTEAELKQLSTEITRVKNNSDLPDMEAFTRDFEKIKKEYDNLLTKEKKMDYDDQILFSIRIFKKFPYINNYYKSKYRYICVDEAQDTSQKQHELIRMLVSDNIFMVGDEDQSIYSFRGAFPRALTNFERNYPNPYILRMETNYRSYKEIIEPANKFISRNYNRHPKHMLASRDKGGVIEAISYKERREEYNKIAELCSDIQEETAVLYRDSDCAINLIAKLIKANIPFNLLQNSTTFFTNRKVIDTLALIEFYLDDKNYDAFERVFYLFGFKKEAAKNLVKYCRYNDISITNATVGNSNGKQIHDVFGDLACETVSGIVKHAAFMIARKDNNPITHRYCDVLTLLGENVSSINDYVSYINELNRTIASYENKKDVLLTLSTIHSAKGMEFKNVIILDAYEGVLPKTPINVIEENEDKKDLYQEERRLFYVAMTRAKDKLSVVRLDNEKCSFVDEIFGIVPKEVCPYRNISSNSVKGFPHQDINIKTQHILSTTEKTNNTQNTNMGVVKVEKTLFKSDEQKNKQKLAEKKEQEAYLHKQQREQREKEEMRRIHEETGGYIGNKVNGKYQISSLEEMTSRCIPSNYLVEFSENKFMSYIEEIREYRQNGVKMIFSKMCHINSSEKTILLKIFNSLKDTDAETAYVLEYLMKKAGICH